MTKPNQTLCEVFMAEKENPNQIPNMNTKQTAEKEVKKFHKAIQCYSGLPYREAVTDSGNAPSRGSHTVNVIHEVEVYMDGKWNKWSIYLVRVFSDESWLANTREIGAQEWGEKGFPTLGLAKAYISRLIKGSNGHGWQMHEFFILQPKYSDHDRFYVYVK